MKVRTIALAAAFALSSTFALAQGTGAQGGATGVPGVKTNPTPDQTTGANTKGPTQNGANPVESDKMGGPNTGTMGGETGTSTSSPGKDNNNH